MAQMEQDPFFVFHDFEDSEPDQPRSEWPLHFTVTPFFTLEQVSQEEALDTIARISEDALPIEVFKGEDDFFGPNNDIPVTRITDATSSRELHRLHTRLVHELGNLGCRFTDYSYALENYSPHVSHKPGGPILTDGRYVARSMSVGTKLAQPKPNKVIVKRIEL